MLKNDLEYLYRRLPTVLDGPAETSEESQATCHDEAFRFSLSGDKYRRRVSDGVALWGGVGWQRQRLMLRTVAG